MSAHLSWKREFKRAAQLTSLSPNTLKRLAHTGKLRTTRIGRRRIVPIEALRELIQDGPVRSVEVSWPSFHVSDAASWLLPSNRAGY
jgi:excisionase family DNA binding protein